MPNTVAVLGGGVAGLSAAHALAERGFQVHVYERKPVLGGKARSIPVANSGGNGRLPLPGEHGFRFFPDFYKHVTGTMRRTPAADARRFAGVPDGTLHPVWRSAGGVDFLWQPPMDGCDELRGAPAGRIRKRRLAGFHRGDEEAEESSTLTVGGTQLQLLYRFISPDGIFDSPTVGSNQRRVDRPADPVPSEAGGGIPCRNQAHQNPDRRHAGDRRECGELNDHRGFLCRGPAGGGDGHLKDEPLVSGHAIYLDSPWALTAISQRQFWTSVDSRYGDGTVGGILSVDISDWDAPSVVFGKPARECDPAGGST